MRQPVAVGAYGGGRRPAVAVARRTQTARAPSPAPLASDSVSDMRRRASHERQGLFLTGPAHECESRSLLGNCSSKVYDIKHSEQESLFSYQRL
ncbi:unnamed protein product [Leptosia nina]|uniref:Uncharacterized protein n=1 Tax=Leptosia nina TaxID=320188 RepID=A0AAV1JU47_9NEOP